VNNKPPGKLATLNIFYYEFLRNVQRLAEAVGDSAVQSTFKNRADGLGKLINRTYYDKDKKLYYETPDRREPSPFASTLAVQYGLVPAEDLDRVFAFAAGKNLRPGIASPWFMYNALEAFGSAGRYGDAVASMKKYWGPFLDNGSGVYWEMWNIPGEDVTPIDGYTTEMVAQTITYACGPAPYIVRHVLGVQPAAPGFERALIAPHYSGLREASGSVPTPKGDVLVKWSAGKSGGRTTLTLTVPPAMQATIEVPYSGKQPIVTLNGKSFFDGKDFHTVPGAVNPERRGDVIAIQATGGKYVFVSTGKRSGKK
jgi:alpha-L-rhamnosidase